MSEVTMGEDDDDALMSMHPQTRRTAIIDVSGDTLWLYLTAPNELRPVSDCWLANRGTTQIADPRAAGLPPPAPEKVIRDTASNQQTPAAYQLEWSRDGEAVRAMMGDRAVAFAAADIKRGFNDDLLVDCPWGHPFDEALHEKLFSPTSGRTG